MPVLGFFVPGTCVQIITMSKILFIFPRDTVGWGLENLPPTLEGSKRFRAMIGIESLGILISSALPAASYIYTKTLIQETLFHHRLLPFKPRPQLCNRFPPSISLPVSTTYRPFLNPPFQTFLILVPVSLSSKCDTRPLHPLANTSSKPPVPLVWFMNPHKTSPLYLTIRPYMTSLQLSYFQTLSKQRTSWSKPSV